MGRRLDDDERRQRIKDGYYEDSDSAPGWYTKGKKLQKQNLTEKIMNLEIRKQIKKRAEEYKKDIPDVLREKIKEENYGNEETLFILAGAIDFLRQDVSNDTIKLMGHYVWELIGSGHIGAGMSPHATTVMFAVIESVQHKPREHPVILLDPNWTKRIEKYPADELAGIVFCASQALDFWSGRYPEEAGEIMVERSLAHEAEFLLGLEKQYPDWKPYGKLKDVVKRYPKGLNSERARNLIYTWKTPPSWEMPN